MAGRERGAAPLLPLLLLTASCAALRYEPCPLRLPQPLPADAFPRCRDELLRRYGALAVADADGFLLQTEWSAVTEPVGERRASVFRGDDGRDLAVVVEFRWLQTPWFGVPRWSDARGDAAAERELADALRTVLSADR